VQKLSYWHRSKFDRVAAKYILPRSKCRPGFSIFNKWYMHT